MANTKTKKPIKTEKEPVAVSEGRMALVHRLNRAQGQIEAIKKSLMESQPLDCVQAMHLLKASQQALKKFGEAYVSEHLESCIREKTRPNDLKKALDEVIQITFQ